MAGPKMILMLCGMFCLWMITGCGESPTPQRKQAPTSPSAPPPAPIYYSIAGGPVGGSYNSFANGISVTVTREHPDIKLLSEGSLGSVANLKNLDQGKVDLAVVNMTDAALARTGGLPNDPGRYEGVRAVAFLYSSLAQLVVRANSPIRSIDQLVGRRVALGNPGSGSIVVSQRLLTHIGLWDKIEPVTIGFQDAAKALHNNQIEAFFVMAGYPNAAVQQIAQPESIRLIPLSEPATHSGFLLANPSYSLAVVPANTYANQTQPTPTFSQAVYLCAGKNVPDALVGKCLKSLFTQETLSFLRAATPMAKATTLANGLNSCQIPIHPTAAKFWSAHGVYPTK